MRSVCATLASVSAVGVLVIDCTAMGRAEPIVTPPMRTSCALRREYSVRFMIFRILIAIRRSYVCDSQSRAGRRLAPEARYSHSLIHAVSAVCGPYRYSS